MSDNITYYSYHKIKTIIFYCLISIFLCNLSVRSDDRIFLSIKELNELSLEELMHVTVVTASKYKQRLQEIPAAVTVITANEIQNYGWRSIADILKAQVGFDLFSDRIYDFIVTRGYYSSNDPNSRILLLIDGHSVVEFFGYFNGQLASVDINHIDRLEIIRGPNSVLYGTNAMFAVINVITKSEISEDEINVIHEVGSFKDNKYSLSYRKKSNDLKLSVNGTYHRTGDQILYFDEYDDTAYTSDGFSNGKANLKKTGSSSVLLAYKNLSLRSMYYNSKKQVPTGIYGGKFNEEGTFFHDINQFVELKFEHVFTSNINSTFRIYSDIYDFKGRFKYYLNPLGPTYASEFVRIKNQSYGGEALVVTAWNKSHHTVFGVEYKIYQSLLFNYNSENDPAKILNESFDINPDEKIISLFASHNLSFKDKVLFDVGMHYDNYTSFGGHVSPRGSINFSFSKNGHFKILYGESFRAPNFWELNTRGPIFYVLGDANLKPEVIKCWEFIATDFFNKDINYQISYYNYNVNDVIDQINNKWENVDGNSGQGIELELKYKTSRLQAYTNFSYSKVVHDKNDTRIEFTPNWLLKSGCYKILDNDLTLGVESRLTGSRLKAKRDESKLESYFITNFTLSNIKLNKWLNFSVSVYNLFDKQYQHPSFLPDLATFNMNAQYPVYDIPADGRSFIIKSKIVF